MDEPADIPCMDRRTALRAAAAIGSTLVAGCSSNGGSSEPSAPGSTLEGDPTVSSSAFADGESIPTRYTCDGEDVSPPLSIDGVPTEAEELALVVDDPDAPGGSFTHWLLWGVPPETASIPEDVPTGESVQSLDGASQGTNDADVLGYSGPCPPPEDDAHTYRFRLLALGEPLSLDPGAGPSEFDDAVGDVPRSESVLAGEYDR